MSDEPRNASSVSAPSPGSFEDLHRDAISQHHEQIGRVVIAWNSLQDMFASIFNHVLTNNDGSGVGYAIWHATESDRAQRNMLTALLNHKKKAHPRIFNGVGWAVGQANALSPRRNAIVHAYYGWKPSKGKIEAVPLAGFGSHLSDSLKDKNLDVESDNIKRDCNELRAYCGHLMFFLMDGESSERFPWPRKPKMRTPIRTQSRPESD